MRVDRLRGTGIAWNLYRVINRFSTGGNTWKSVESAKVIHVFYRIHTPTTIGLAAL